MTETAYHSSALLNEVATSSKVSCNKTLILCRSGEPVQLCAGFGILEHRKP